VVLGLSKDSVRSHQKFKAKYEIPFTLLSDPDKRVCEAYGVLKEKNMYGKKVLGVERSTFVIDEKGNVVEAFRKVRSLDRHVAEVLAVLDR
jgi:peroxiredoxin Q/BCP